VRGSGVLVEGTVVAVCGLRAPVGGMVLVLGETDITEDSDLPQSVTRIRDAIINATINLKYTELMLEISSFMQVITDYTLASFHEVDRHG
jgi:hypothetical protein